jgi:hypothetical protein
MPDPAIHILLTSDYEIFGDGSGDVRRVLIEPTAQILSLCEAYGARMTLFFEVAEYWAFVRDPAAEMARQVREAAARGHDAQLHAHPQWLDAEFVDGAWRLNMQWWRTSSLPFGDADNVHSLVGLLSRGKSTLEQMLRPVAPGYECLAFRAGAYCVQPSADFIRAALACGLRIDSSVSKGLVKMDALSQVDFRAAHHHHQPWYVDPGDITREAAPGDRRLFEAPIASAEEPVIRHLRWRDLTRALRRSTKQTTSSPASRSADRLSFGTRLARLFTPSYVGWDYCLPNGRRLFRLLEQFARACDRPVNPLVMIGHPKVFQAPEEFELFLRLTKRHFIDTGRARFSTFPEFLRAFEQSHDRLA